MIEQCQSSNPNVACWSTDGETFIVKDPQTLTKTFFPTYFKHSNFDSFTRQLNFYGFRKIRKTKFQHEFFIRGRVDLLHKITRSTKSNTQREIESLKRSVCELERQVAELQQLVKLGGLSGMVPRENGFCANCASDNDDECRKRRKVKEESALVGIPVKREDILPPQHKQQPETDYTMSTNSVSTKRQKVPHTPLPAAVAANTALSDFIRDDMERRRSIGGVSGCTDVSALDSSTGGNGISRRKRDSFFNSNNNADMIPSEQDCVPATQNLPPPSSQVLQHSSHEILDDTTASATASSSYGSSSYTSSLHKGDLKSSSFGSGGGGNGVDNRQHSSAIVPPAHHISNIEGYDHYGGADDLLEREPVKNDQQRWF